MVRTKPTDVFQTYLPTHYAYHSRPTTHYPPLTANHSSLITHHSPLITHHSPPTTHHHSPLTTHHAPLTTCNLLDAQNGVRLSFSRGFKDPRLFKGPTMFGGGEGAAQQSGESTLGKKAMTVSAMEGDGSTETVEAIPNTHHCPPTAHKPTRHHSITQ